MDIVQNRLPEIEALLSTVGVLAALLSVLWAIHSFGRDKRYLELRELKGELANLNKEFSIIGLSNLNAFEISQGAAEQMVQYSSGLTVEDLKGFLRESAFQEVILGAFLRGVAFSKLQQRQDEFTDKCLSVSIMAATRFPVLSFVLRKETVLMSRMRHSKTLTVGFNDNILHDKFKEYMIHCIGETDSLPVAISQISHVVSMYISVFNNTHMVKLNALGNILEILSRSYILSSDASLRSLSRQEKKVKDSHWRSEDVESSNYQSLFETLKFYRNKVPEKDWKAIQNSVDEIIAERDKAGTPLE